MYALVSVEAETSTCHPLLVAPALLVQHHHHHEINEEAGVSTTWPVLACSAQQHEEVAIATALVPVEAGGGRVTETWTWTEIASRLLDREGASEGENVIGLVPRWVRDLDLKLWTLPRRGGGVRDGDSWRPLAVQRLR